MRRRPVPAGVVATMNKYTKLESCVNNAAVTCSDVTASNSRVAGIVSAMGGHTYLTSCVNNGTVAFAVAGDTTHGYAAGIAGQTNDNNTAIDGCENYGAVLSDIINAAATSTSASSAPTPTRRPSRSATARSGAG